MTKDKMPADWAIVKALEFRGLRANALGVVKALAKENPSTITLARYIETHEQPPVDRKMLCAREAFARATTQVLNAPELYREGAKDDHALMPMVLEAITLWEEGFGK